jgi:hypothetical protein
MDDVDDDGNSLIFVWRVIVPHSWIFMCVRLQLISDTSEMFLSSHTKQTCQVLHVLQYCWWHSRTVNFHSCFPNDKRFAMVTSKCKPECASVFVCMQSNNKFFLPFGEISTKGRYPVIFDIAYLPQKRYLWWDAHSTDRQGPSIHIVPACLHITLV